MNAGVKDIREIVNRASERLGQHGQSTIVFIDEIHRFSTAQQDALLPPVESGLLTLIGATTENPFFSVNSPLRSRSTLFRLEPLDAEAIEQLIKRGIEAESVKAEPAAVELLVMRSAGDGRQALTALEVACALARPGVVTVEHVESALQVSALSYGRDDHYDVISAFIKSIRGGSPDGGLFWLARMLEAGDDPRFIARRLVILASEDVGLADPQALVVAVAAATAVEQVGLPEAQLNLAQAVVYLAAAPKSNSVALGIWGAREDIKRGVATEVPPQFRDAHYMGAETLGHGTEYQYPHNDPRGWVEEDYLPNQEGAPVIRQDSYYRPSPHGWETEVARRLSEHNISENNKE